MDRQEIKRLEEKAEKAVVDKIAPPLFDECAAEVKFYEITEEGKAKLGLKTTCGNCPRAHATIKQSVEVALRTILPEVTGIEPFFL
ncbi:MAG: NifU family protein [Bacteroides sp.]|nr:NifU family protein [Ruminococcus flavefaciens]MCM1553987.1 NifU family protein [Bacteroides sp.]